MITLQVGRNVVVAYSDGQRIGHAILQGKGSWAIRCGGFTHYRKHRRSAVKVLRKAAAQLELVHKVAGSVLHERREAIGGGVQTMGRSA